MSPAWIARKSILSAAEELKLSVSTSKQQQLPDEKSNSLRISLYLHAGKWITMNNRGFALHSLAEVRPQRLVFVTALSTDEKGRLNTTMRHLNFSQSEPVTRRRAANWEAQIPTSVIAVPFTKKDTRVVYTVKAIDMVGPLDHGNAGVMSKCNLLVTGAD
ncbi:hypothetical protein [Pseudoduganella lutea]|uniref:Uncharacterized protein n=1 Tax=Pseudoduganella lutea TaxID=321985 RepID=A0A4P6KTJ3_9BURK|nr:hypothetical protein [Pseudoduganella lutea]QBE61722.1 hypothetical protein EWM63_00845 [Pseudoduganella lutea]